MIKIKKFCLYEADEKFALYMYIKYTPAKFINRFKRFT
jgi:hypothetical protein